MKTLRRLGALLCLSLILVVPVLAGDMQTGLTDPPPPPSASQATISDAGNTPHEFPAALSDQNTVDLLWEFTRDAVESILFLF
jgi:hypothetical protein